MSAIAAALSTYFAWQAIRTSRGERQNQRGDACLIAVSELQSAVHRCLSAVWGKRGREIWPAYTDAWDRQTRFGSAYRLARRYHTGLVAEAPEKIEQLLERLKVMAKNVADEGHDPNDEELDKIAAELREIVNAVWKTNWRRVLNPERRPRSFSETGGPCRSASPPPRRKPPGSPILEAHRGSGASFWVGRAFNLDAGTAASEAPRAWSGPF